MHSFYVTLIVTLAVVMSIILIDTATRAEIMGKLLQPRPYICAEREVMTSALIDLGEVPHGAGFTSEGGLFELWAQKKTDDSSWSVLLSLPNGYSCIVGHGESWTPIDSSPERGNQT